MTAPLEGRRPYGVAPLVCAPALYFCALRFSKASNH